MKGWSCFPPGIKDDLARGFWRTCVMQESLPCALNLVNHLGWKRNLVNALIVDNLQGQSWYSGRTTWFAVDSRAWYKRHVLKNGRAENIGRGGFSAHRVAQAHFRGQAI